MSSVLFPRDHTAAEWNAKAAECSARSARSFENCDTDGYLSQWASDVMATRYRLAAELAAAGGVWSFRALADLDGNRLDAREVRTRYGWAWAITNPDGSTTWFNESVARNAKARAANNARKGYRFVEWQCDAVVIGTESGGFYAPARGAEGRVLGDYREDD